MNRVLAALLLLNAVSPACATGALSLTVQYASVEPDPIDPSKVQIDVRLTSRSGTEFATFTTEHVGQKIEVLVDGKAVSAPARLLTPIFGGVVVFYPVPSGKAEQIAREISTGFATFGIELLP